MMKKKDGGERISLKNDIEKFFFIHHHHYHHRFIYYLIFFFFFLRIYGRCFQSLASYHNFCHLLIAPQRRTRDSEVSRAVAQNLERKFFLILFIYFFIVYIFIFFMLLNWPCHQVQTRFLYFIRCFFFQNNFFIGIYISWSILL